MCWPSVARWLCLFHTERDCKGNLCTMETEGKMETHRWRNNNLHAEISKWTCAHLKGKLCSPRQNRKSEHMSVLKTAEKSPRVAQQMPSYKMWFLCISTLFTCLHFLLLASYTQRSFQTHHHETAIFISVARRFHMLCLNKKGQLPL